MHPYRPQQRARDVFGKPLAGDFFHHQLQNQIAAARVDELTAGFYPDLYDGVAVRGSRINEGRFQRWHLFRRLIVTEPEAIRETGGMAEQLSDGYLIVVKVAGRQPPTGEGARKALS